MDENNLNFKVLFLLKKTRALYSKIIEKHAKKVGLSKQEADILLFFSCNKKLDSAHCAVTYCGFSKAYVSKAINLLIEKKYIKAVFDEKDKRYQHIILQKESEKAIMELKKGQKEFFDIIRKGMTNEELLEHIRIVNKIKENIIKEMKG